MARCRKVSFAAELTPHRDRTSASLLDTPGTWTARSSKSNEADTNTISRKQQFKNELRHRPDAYGSPGGSLMLFVFKIFVFVFKVFVFVFKFFVFVFKVFVFVFKVFVFVFCLLVFCF